MAHRPPALSAAPYRASTRSLPVVFLQPNRGQPAKSHLVLGSSSKSSTSCSTARVRAKSSMSESAISIISVIRARPPLLSPDSTPAAGYPTFQQARPFDLTSDSILALPDLLAIRDELQIYPCASVAEYFFNVRQPRAQWRIHNESHFNFRIPSTTYKPIHHETPPHTPTLESERQKCPN